MREKLQRLRALASNISLLYVEDDDEIRLRYAKFLSHFFSDITLAKDGLEGLELSKKRRYDLIISDIVMPKMSGLEMIAQIKKENPSQVVIFISAYNDAAMLESAIGIGVDGYLFKPLRKDKSIELLCKTVNSIGMSKQSMNYKATLESLVEQKTQELVQTYSIDKITQLYSMNRLQQDIETHASYSIAICKIQGFKVINDIYGYEAGDALLLQTAQILKKSFAQELEGIHYFLYRVSGTHFVVLADTSSLKLYAAMQKSVEFFEASEIIIEGETLFVEMNAAVVDERCETSLSNADKALREAQSQKSVILFSRNTQEEENRKNKIKCKEHLSQAIDHHRIVPYYQPIVSNKTNEVVKFEALARMVLPDGEVVSPARFLPTAKESKLYHNITYAIIEQAFHDFERLPYSLSLNLSMIDIHNKKTKNFIFDALKKFPQPERIVFEILETEEILSYNELQKFIANVQALGAKVAIDDFGSGYSNFTHLLKLNVDYVKIDGSLISELCTSFASKTIVEMLSKFASEMGIKTIAEFVSSQEISNLVISLKLDESQGYLFAEPLPLEEALARLKN
jgi:diguanylate cyclase (GGDEF)-like protein